MISPPPLHYNNDDDKDDCKGDDDPKQNSHPNRQGPEASPEPVDNAAKPSEREIEHSQDSSDDCRDSIIDRSQCKAENSNNGCKDHRPQKGR